MSKMNWGRVNAENHMRRHTDYSQRMDEADLRAQIDAVFDALEYQERHGRHNPPPQQAKPPKRVKPARPPLPARGTAQRASLEAEAALTGRTPAQLWLNGKADGSSAKPKPKPPGLTGAQKLQRLDDEARELGITADELKTRRRAKAAEEFALHERAVAIGITTKELRRRLSAGIEH